MAPALVVREPVGVIGAVVPFNGPIMSAAAKLAPVLASGCPIVFKPAAETPLDAFVLAEAAEAAGIPPGVVNIVPGGADVGAATRRPRGCRPSGVHGQHRRRARHLRGVARGRSSG